jgi:hypothetical protein
MLLDLILVDPARERTREAVLTLAASFANSKYKRSVDAVIAFDDANRATGLCRQGGRR